MSSANITNYIHHQRAERKLISRNIAFIQIIFLKERSYHSVISLSDLIAELKLSTKHLIALGFRELKEEDVTIYNGWISPEGTIIPSGHKQQAEKIDKLFKQLGKKPKKEKANNGGTNKDKGNSGSNSNSGNNGSGDSDDYTLEEMKAFAISEGYVLVDEDRIKKEISFTHNYKEWNIPTVITDAINKITFRYRKQRELEER